MAYRDIEMWKQILEAEDQEQKAYDEACAEREAEGRKLDEQEFWDCDQEEIDPKTMGIGDVAVSGSPELADVEDVDEDIDFSRYGIEEDEELNEADMREPLTAATAALGRPASTANLDSQDSVTLAEAIMELTKCLKEKKLAEAEDDQPAGAEAAGGEEEESPEYRAAAQAEAESKEALEAAKRFYSQWLSDPDFRRRAALKTPEGAVKKVPAGYWKKGKDGRNEITTADDPDPAKRQVRGYVVAGTDPNSELARRFKGYFDLMTDVDKAAFDTWARQQRRFATKHYAPKKPESANKRGDLHGKGGDDDDDVNPLAQHGLDQTFNADNADDGMFDDFDTGEEFYSEFNPDYQTVSHEGVARHILDVADAEAKKMGIGREEFFSMFKKLGELAKIRKTVLDKGKKNRQLTDYQVEYIFSALDPEQLDELKAELIRDAGGNRKERAFIEYLFRFGKERQVNLKDLLKEFGVAGDQTGDTGAGTQQGDAMIYVIVCALADAFNIMQDEAAELWRVKSAQAPSARDRNSNIEPRKYARHLACKII